MTTIPQPINVAVLDSATVLYTAFVDGGASRAMLASLDLCNTTTADISVDLYWEDGGDASKRYLADDLVVPAKGSATWRGLVTLDTATDLIKAIASATGVDALGTVLES